MVSIRINDSDTRSAVKSLVSLCSAEQANIILCDEECAADTASESASEEVLAGAVIALYRKGAYLYSDAHVKLSQMYGSRYTAIPMPIDYGRFSVTLTEMAAAVLAGGTVAHSAEAVRNDRIRVSEADCSLTLGEMKVKLTAREMALFICLRDRCGKAVSREILKNEVWGDDAEDGTNIVDVYVSYLRRKLKPLMGEGAIISIRGEGYMLAVPQ